MKNKICILVLFAFVALCFVGTSSYPVDAVSPVTERLNGKNWSYSVGFEVHNSSTIEKLINCESQGVNVSRLDSNNRISDGILQYNRGASNLAGSGTWGAWSKASGITGDPRIPSDAIEMADWAISNGLIGHWSCAHILHLVK